MKKYSLPRKMALALNNQIPIVSVLIIGWKRTPDKT